MPQTPLSKKTKADLLEEYKELLSKYEELQATSGTVHEPQSLELVRKASQYTEHNIKKTATDVRNSVNALINNISSKLEAEAQKLQELQHAIEISNEKLKLNYQIEVAAETLRQLITENETKRESLEKELGERKIALNDEIENQKRQWEREQDERKYQTELKYKREEAARQELRQKKEKELAERETAIQQKEEEEVDLKKQIEETPKKIEKEVAIREQEIARRIQAQFNATLQSEKQKWESERKLTELKITSLQNQLKVSNTEIAILKQETEKATKRSQELAVKVIESGAKFPSENSERPSRPQETKPSNQRPFQRFSNQPPSP